MYISCHIKKRTFGISCHLLNNFFNSISKYSSSNHSSFLLFFTYWLIGFHWFQDSIYLQRSNFVLMIKYAQEHTIHISRCTLSAGRYWNWSISVSLLSTNLKLYVNYWLILKIAREFQKPPQSPCEPIFKESLYYAFLGRTIFACMRKIISHNIH
jgi:hypothetical protein